MDITFNIRTVLRNTAHDSALSLPTRLTLSRDNQLRQHIVTKVAGNDADSAGVLTHQALCDRIGYIAKLLRNLQNLRARLRRDGAFAFENFADRLEADPRAGGDIFQRNIVHLPALT